MRLEHVLSAAADPAHQMKLKQARTMIEEQRVSVAGKVVTECSHQVLLGMEDVTLDGLSVDTSSVFHRLLLFHKPVGSVCESASSERSIFRLLTPDQQHPTLTFFGRLDRDTTGLMLLGTDGGIGHLLTNPDCHVAKEYWALLTGIVPLEEHAEQQFAEGLRLSDGTVCRPATLHMEPDGCTGPAAVLAESTAAGTVQESDGCHRHQPTGDIGAPPDSAAVRRTTSASKQERHLAARGSGLPCVSIVLHEGCNHQVKKMLAACNGNVVRLHREAIGPLRLAELDIPVGTARCPTPAEMQVILSLLPVDCRDAKTRSDRVRARRKSEAGIQDSER